MQQSCDCSISLLTTDLTLDLVVVFTGDIERVRFTHTNRRDVL